MCGFALAGICAGAQNIIDNYPEHGGSREIDLPFAMSRKAYPENRYYSWMPDGGLTWHDGKAWQKPKYFSPGKEVTPEWTLVDEPGGSLRIAKGGDTLTVAVSEKPGIVYGRIVSRNEFGIDRGLFPAPDGKRVAFYRKDESAVTEFPLLDISSRTGSLRSIRYPMNGMTSEQVTLGIYDTVSGETIWLEVDDFTPERYLTGITWSPDSRRIYIQVLDRPQHNMHLNVYDAATGKYIRTLIAEKDDRWVEPLDPLYFLEGRNDLFIYRSYWRSTHRSLYLVDTLGNYRLLPSASADVEYVANNGKSVFYTSMDASGAERHLLRMDLSLPKRDVLKKARFSKPVQLTSGRGWHDVSLSPDKTLFIDRRSSFSEPGETSLRSTDGKRDSLLFTSSDPLEGYRCGSVEFGTVKSADGRFDNFYRLLRPAGFDPSKKYPVIVYVYGGPHSQMVRDSWLGQIRMWEMYMASRGYIVYVQDNRGTSNRGEVFEKAINRRCGVVEMEDQMEGIKMLSSLPYVDTGRIGVHGWSYGGFMTISLMTTYPDVFKVGAAGGPVIDWKWYEIMYGERYMDNPETNPEGFASTSLIEKADRLQGKLLICQGMQDNTVVPQNCMSFVQKCIDLGKQLDFFPYPVAEHNVFGPNRVHLMQKISDYFDDNL